MHVVVLGAGYAGLSLARELEDALSDGHDITVVDERDTHLVQHLVHYVVRHPSLADDLTIPIDDLLNRAEHRQARVTDVDPDAGEVELEAGSLTYDVGVLALGARTAFYDLPGVEAHATPLKRVRHAERIRADAVEVCDGGGTIVVGGAGLSGIQVAGELAELAAEADAEVTVRLLEQRDTVAPNFPDSFQRAVAEELTDRGVHVATGRTVERADEDAIELVDGDSIAYDQFVWTGGIAGSDATDGARPRVRADLRLGERTFAIGDAARVVDSDGRAAPASAQTAVRQADVAAENVLKLLEHRREETAFRPRFETYRYDELGWLVSVGDGAVAQVGPSVVRGAAAKALKTTVGAGYLGSVGAVQNAADYVWETVGGDRSKEAAGADAPEGTGADSPEVVDLSRERDDR